VAKRIKDRPDIDMQVGRARSLLRKVADKASEQLQSLPIDEAADKFMRALSDPRTVAMVQRTMSTVGGRGMEAAFKREPHARLLFDFAEWCEQQSDRGDVMGVLIHDTLMPDGAFAQISRPIQDLGLQDDPLRAFLATPPTDSLIEVFRSAQLGLLQTLCRMAALGTGVEPPDAKAPLHTLVSFFKDSGIPEEFKVLADLALGHGESPSTPSGGDAAVPPVEEARTTALARVKRMLPVRSLPPGFRFLVGTYLVFLHSYLSRNMVDAYPRVMEKVREEMDGQQAAADATGAEAGEVLDMTPAEPEAAQPEAAEPEADAPEAAEPKPPSSTEP